jgi:hypothetical protein
MFKLVLANSALKYFSLRLGCPIWQARVKQIDRKMCAVVPAHLGKGVAAHPRCIPRPVARFGIEPSSRH